MSQHAIVATSEPFAEHSRSSRGSAARDHGHVGCVVRSRSQRGVATAVNQMILSPTVLSTDHDGQKGAVEDDRPDLRGAPGLDDDGLPNDATAIAQDALGARIDQSQG